MNFIVAILEFIPWCILLFFPWRSEAIRHLFSTYLGSAYGLGFLSSLLVIVISLVIDGNDWLIWMAWGFRIIAISTLLLIICTFLNRVAVALQEKDKARPEVPLSESPDVILHDPE